MGLLCLALYYSNFGRGHCLTDPDSEGGRNTSGIGQIPPECYTHPTQLRQIMAGLPLLFVGFGWVFGCCFARAWTQASCANVNRLRLHFSLPALPKRNTHIRRLQL